MTINSYDLGVVVRVSWTITASSAAVDPTAMTFKSRYGLDGTITTLTMGTDAALVKDSTGHYHVDLTLASEGELYYRVDATGANAVAAEGQLTVNGSTF
jgi:hypothetical protein